MKYFKKLLNTGNLSANLSEGSEVNGQPVSGRRHIRPGDIVKCNPADLGKSGIKSFEEITAPTGKPKSPLKAEIARLESILRQKSVWLNPGYRPEVGQFIHIPGDSAGLTDFLAGLEDESFNTSGQAIGAMSSGKAKLKSAWDAWRYLVTTDPNGMKKLKEPTDPHLSAIALMEAQMSILKGEICEVRRRLAAAVEAEAGQAGARVEKLRFKGFGKLKNGLFVQMDGRAVHYPDGGKPVFVDNGQTVEDYKLEIKKHRAERSARKQAEIEAAPRRGGGGGNAPASPSRGSRPGSVFSR